MTRRLLLMLLAVMGWPGTLVAGQSQQGLPRFEAGGNVGVITAIGEGVFPLVAAGPRFSIALSNRVAVELLGEIIAPTESSGLYGIYQVQIKHVIRDKGPARSAIFVTGGTAGGFEYDRQRERRDERPDGSVVVYPAHTEAELTAPLALSAGIGVQRVFARYTALRAEAQTIVAFGGGFAVRGSVGISVPLGAGYSRRP